MRIFHTSDWHLGKMLGDWDRSEDFVFFLDWLLAKIEERRPDILLIAGDVFDVSMPSIAAQRLYYGFLQRAASTSLSAVVVTAGNHDSQAFLSAPAALLAGIRTFVAGATPEEQSVLVRDREGMPLAAIAAIPFLKEGEVRKGLVTAGELDEFAAYEAGIEKRYAEAYEQLVDLMDRENARNVPKIAMGHLYLRDALPKEKRSELLSRPEIGTIRMVDLSRLGTGWDYVAMGHIHRAGKIEGGIRAAYSGAPLALSFTHRTYRHQIIELTFDEKGVEEVIHDVPQKRAVVRLSGLAKDLPLDLENLAAESPECYVGLELTDPKPTRDLLEPLTEKAETLGLRLVNITVARPAETIEQAQEGLTLDMLTPSAVLEEVLRRAGRDEADNDRLRALFAQIVEAVEHPKNKEDEVSASETTAQRRSA